MTHQITTNLSHKMLAATPFKFVGGMFAKSLIYVLSHDKSGSVGLLINRPVSPINIQETFQNSILGNENLDSLKIPVHIGGSVDLYKGFFLHSSDYEKNLLYKLPDNLSLSSNSSIVQDIIQNVGPKNSLFIVGYTHWDAGQMEDELSNNLWIVIEDVKDLIFLDEDPDEKWRIALEKVGIKDSNFLVMHARA